MLAWLRARKGPGDYVGIPGTGPWFIPSANGPWWWNAVSLCRGAYYPPGGQDWFQRFSDAIANGGPGKPAAPSLGSGGDTFFWPGAGTTPPFYIWKFPGCPAQGAIIVIRGTERAGQEIDAFLGSYIEAVPPYPGPVNHTWRLYAEEILAVIQAQFPWFLAGPMYFLGHSLGGSVGLLLAWKIHAGQIGAGKVMLSISVGAPKAGGFYMDLGAKSIPAPSAQAFPYFRLRDPWDPITYLPPTDANNLYYLLVNRDVDRSLTPRQPIAGVGLNRTSHGSLAGRLEYVSVTDSEDLSSAAFARRLHAMTLQINHHFIGGYAGEARLVSRAATQAGDVFSRHPNVGICNVRLIRDLNIALDAIEAP